MYHIPKKSPIPLYCRAKDGPVAWVCGTCKRLHTRETINTCCSVKVCDCGEQYDATWAYTICPACYDKREAAKLQDLVDHAERVESYDGPIYSENLDDYYPDFDTAWDALTQGDIVWEPNMRGNVVFWACNIVKFSLNMDDIIDNELANNHAEESIISDAKAVANLQEEVDLWIKYHADHVETWYPDKTRLHPVDDSYWADYDKELAEIREEPADNSEEPESEPAPDPAPQGRPDCTKCKWRQSIQGDEHISCGHPFSDPMNNGNLNIVGSPHGIEHGWFMWPFNFDPTWLLNCNGFEEKQNG